STHPSNESVTPAIQFTPSSTQHAPQSPWSQYGGTDILVNTQPHSPGPWYDHPSLPGVAQPLPHQQLPASTSQFPQGPHQQLPAGTSQFPQGPHQQLPTGTSQFPQGPHQQLPAGTSQFPQGLHQQLPVGTSQFPQGLHQQLHTGTSQSSPQSTSLFSLVNPSASSCHTRTCFSSSNTLSVPPSTQSSLSSIHWSTPPSITDCRDTGSFFFALYPSQQGEKSAGILMEKGAGVLTEKGGEGHKRWDLVHWIKWYSTLQTTSVALTLSHSENTPPSTLLHAPPPNLLFPAHNLVFATHCANLPVQ
ncbi:hypothetical protein M405DRAFT_868721, partial [Rhizopogon salebrosus TDB-379]